MANLRKRIQKLTKLRGPVEQKGINSLDLFLVGALTGLYSKKLLIQNDTQKVSRVSDSGSAQITKTQLSQDEQANGNEYSEKIKSIVNKLKLKGYEEGLMHKKIYRPWGNYISLVQDKKIFSIILE